MIATEMSSNLTPAEAAVQAGRSEATILRWIRRKLLPARRDGVSGRLTIAAADLERLLAGPATGAAGSR